MICYSCLGVQEVYVTLLAAWCICLDRTPFPDYVKLFQTSAHGIDQDFDLWRSSYTDGAPRHALVANLFSNNPYLSNKYHLWTKSELAGSSQSNQNKFFLWSVYKYQFFIYYCLVVVRSCVKRTGFEWFVELMRDNYGSKRKGVHENVCIFLNKKVRAKKTVSKLPGEQ